MALPRRYIQSGELRAAGALLVRAAPGRIAAAALLAGAWGCAAGPPQGDTVRRDSAGIAMVENRAPASPRAWRLDVAAARPIDLPAADAGAAAVAVLLGGGFVIADDRGSLAWFDRRGKATRSAVLPEEPAVGALYAGAEGGLVGWDGNRMAVLGVGADGSPGGARSYEAALPAGSVLPLGAFADGSLLVSVRDARTFRVSDQPGRDTLSLLRLEPGGRSRQILSVAGPEQLTWGGAGGAVRIAIPFARAAAVAVAGDRVWVADAERGELRAHDASGRPRTVVRAPIRGDAVDSADVAAWRDRLRRLARGYLTGEGLRRLEGSLALPDSWPPFTALLAGPRGELWVRGGSAPASDARWNVFDATGRWLGTLAVPARFELAAAGEDFVILRERASGSGNRLVLVSFHTKGR